jgi:2-keto-4-pentenoate hydratase/2-oxohepta-3-ene-1,7-dioic acid hydratase in catechol pathway
MHLFSYLSNGQVRSARLVEGLGIDICLAIKEFQKERRKSPKVLDGNTVSLIGLYLPGKVGIQIVEEATNWVMNSLPASEVEYRKTGLVINYNDADLKAPISRPGKVICIAGNFPAPGKMEKPEYPTVFLKPSSGVIGYMNPIIIPQVAQNTVYEVELAVIIGKSGKNIPQNKVDSFIAGYTLANDLGDRLLEKRTSQWTSGKMFDTFTPMGPVLITPDELADSTNLKMFTKVNDQLVQKGNTSQMFFNIPFLISYLSTLTTLEPGDVILTGSPKLMDGEPNPLCELCNGDLVEIGIETLGSLMNPVTIDTEVA